MSEKLTQAELLEKWSPIINLEDAPVIKDAFRKKVMAQMLESTEQGLAKGELSHLLMESSGAVASTFSADLQGDRKGYDPVLFSLIRRTMPNLVSYDIMGTQAMNGPTGLVFALRPKFVDQTDPLNPILGADAFYNEADSDFSGTGTQAGTSPAVLNNATAGVYTAGKGISTANAERMGTAGGQPFREMGFAIDKVTVTATSRKLKGSLTNEVIQDLRAIHGIDASSEVNSILQSELIAEINREMLRTTYIVAKPGAQHADLANAGQFDLTLDSNGRWAKERFLGMYFQIEREANQIAKETRRGRGNILICSSDVASALQMAGMLDYQPAFNGNNLQIDDTGNTFAGILNGKYKVFIDPYADTLADDSNFFVVGYKGANAYDAGLYYAPYQPLNVYKAQDPNSFQPVMGVESRYGIVMNPFAKGVVAPASNGALEANVNVYYRRTQVKNLIGATA
jgi:hypothetical protein